MLIDALDYTSPFYKRLYQKTYSLLISKIPWLWGFVFQITDIGFLRGIITLLRRMFNSINAKVLTKYLQRENFDYIFSTHFFPNEVASFLKQKNQIKSKLISIITDFDVHSIWLEKAVNRYTVACEYTKQRLLGLGIPEENISVFGIPTHRKFSSELDQDEIRKRLNIKKDIFTVLVATGSFGIGPIEEMIEALKDYQILVVCGHNKNLFLRLHQKETEHLVVYGLVDNMHELMAVSDCMITKPGGLSISEALVSQLPLIFFHTIPGQETNNIRILKKYGVGITETNIHEMALQVNKLNSCQNEMIAAQKAMQTLARPHATDDLIALIS